MKELIPFLFRRDNKPMDGKLRERLSVFLFCLFFSIVMWGLTKLSHEYDVIYKYRIEASSVPEGMVLMSQPDSIIQVSIKGSGVELYRNLFSSRIRKLPLSIKNIGVSQKDGRFLGFMRSSTLRNQLSATLPKGASINSIEPDTIRFFFEPSYSRRVPLHAPLKLQFTPQFQLYDSVQILPDTLIVSGLRNIVDTIGLIYTEQKTFKDLNTDLTARLKVIKPQTTPPVQVSADSVTVRLKVEKFTEAQIMLPVRMDAGDNEISYRLFPESVQITCRISMRDYARLDPAQFTALVYYSDILEHYGDRIPVEIVTKPEYVRIIRIEPEKVEYLIMK